MPIRPPAIGEISPDDFEPTRADPVEDPTSVATAAPATLESMPRSESWSDDVAAVEAPGAVEPKAPPVDRPADVRSVASEARPPGAAAPPSVADPAPAEAATSITPVVPVTAVQPKPEPVTPLDTVTEASVASSPASVTPPPVVAPPPPEPTPPSTEVPRTEPRPAPEPAATEPARAQEPPPTDFSRPNRAMTASEASLIGPLAPRRRAVTLFGQRRR